jgi:hypothetical protein
MTEMTTDELYEVLKRARHSLKIRISNLQGQLESVEADLAEIENELATKREA